MREAYVIGHDGQDVGRALGRGDALGEVQRGVLGRAADLAFEWLCRTRQDFLRLCWKRVHRAQRNAERGGGNENVYVGDCYNGAFPGGLACWAAPAFAARAAR